MRGDEARDRAFSYTQSDIKKAGESSLEAIKLYSSELVFTSIPTQKSYIKSNIDRCIEIAKRSLDYEPVYKESNGSVDFVPIKSEIRMSDVIGLNDAKIKLKEDLEDFEYIRNLPGIKKPKGMILYGPPGCGKTMLGKALAGEFDLDFYYISCADILSKYYGESTRLVKELYDTARKNQSIIFIDEFEELASRKDSDSHEATRKIINQFLVELDGVENNENVYTIGATNMPFSIEPAILRRLRPLNVPLPDERTRNDILEKILSGHDVECEYIAHLTESKNIQNVDYFFSCDDIIELVGLSSRIKWRAVKDKNLRLNTDDVKRAYDNFMPSVSRNDLERYFLMENTMKSSRPKLT